MMFIDAPLSTIQTLAIVTSLPLMVVIFIMLYGFFKWIGGSEEAENEALVTSEDAVTLQESDSVA